MPAAAKAGQGQRGQRRWSACSGAGACSGRAAEVARCVPARLAGVRQAQCSHLLQPARVMRCALLDPLQSCARICMLCCPVVLHAVQACESGCMRESGELILSSCVAARAGQQLIPRAAGSRPSGWRCPPVVGYGRSRNTRAGSTADRPLTTSRGPRTAAPGFRRPKKKLGRTVYTWGTGPRTRVEPASQTGGLRNQTAWAHIGRGREPAQATSPGCAAMCSWRRAHALGCALCARLGGCAAAQLSTHGQIPRVPGRLHQPLARQPSRRGANLPSRKQRAAPASRAACRRQRLSRPRCAGGSAERVCKETAAPGGGMETRKRCVFGSCSGAPERWGPALVTRASALRGVASPGA